MIGEEWDVLELKELSENGYRRLGHILVISVTFIFIIMSSYFSYDLYRLHSTDSKKLESRIEKLDMCWSSPPKNLRHENTEQHPQWKY